MIPFTRSFLWASASLILLNSGKADVIINEIFYNAPADLERLEYVELHNTSDKPTPIGDWEFTKGIEYTFSKEAQIEANGYLILCRDLNLFREFYGDIEVYDVFEKSLDNGGETLTLKNADGKKVDSVKYDDKDPWAKSADGYSASLERICPTANAKEESWNWAPSILSDDYSRKTSGTPGKQNSNHAATLPPVIEEVTFPPEVRKPNETITVSAVVAETTSEVELCYRVAAPGSESEETVLTMKHGDGNQYSASIPGTESNRIIRFRVKATNQQGDARYHPHQNAIRPAFSVYVSDEIVSGKIPVAHFFNVGEDEFTRGAGYRTGHAQPRSRGRGGFGDRGGRRPDRGDFGDRGERRGGWRGPAAQEGPPLRPQGRSAFIYTDPETKQSQLFDYINITPRKSGNKVRLHKDKPLNGMTTLNFLYERNESSTLNEALAYEVYRQAGNATAEAGFMRVMIDGEVAGYHLWFEQPNGTFFRRHNIDDKGNLYKLIWMGSHRPTKYTPKDKIPDRMDIVGKHEKKTNPHDGYEDIVSLIETLEAARGDDAKMWQVIQEQFDVDQVINYFAVNALLSHWDGFFNNYFLYHDTNDTKKWTLYPWDQDSTWSQRMGGPWELSTMPLNFGAEGARPAGAAPLNDTENDDRGRDRGRGGFRGFGGGRGGPGWWRDGGDVSKPLLANPQFYERFCARLKILAETTFNEDVFSPKIEAVRTSIEPEVRLRAETFNQDSDTAARGFQDTMDVFGEHLKLRRAFILKELGQ
ncbi:MAG: hypothetical protein ACI957_005791 [Verrucomicrobiales bacterium]|jgi:hypothetical protein